MTVFVVDATGFGRREGIVGFGYLDKLLGGRFVATVFAQISTTTFNPKTTKERTMLVSVAWGKLTGSYQGGISCLGFCKLS